MVADSEHVKKHIQPFKNISVNTNEIDTIDFSPSLEKRKKMNISLNAKDNS